MFCTIATLCLLVSKCFCLSSPSPFAVNNEICHFFGPLRHNLKMLLLWRLSNAPNSSSACIYISARIRYWLLALIQTMSSLRQRNLPYLSLYRKYKMFVWWIDTHSPRSLPTNGSSHEVNLRISEIWKGSKERYPSDSNILTSKWNGLLFNSL